MAEERRRSTRSNFGRHPECLGFNPVSVPIHTFTQDTLCEEIEKIEEEIAEISAGILDLSTKQQASPFLARSSHALTTDTNYTRSSAPVGTDLPIHEKPKIVSTESHVVLPFGEVHSQNDAPWSRAWEYTHRRQYVQTGTTHEPWPWPRNSQRYDSIYEACTTDRRHSRKRKKKMWRNSGVCLNSKPEISRQESKHSSNSCTPRELNLIDEAWQWVETWSMNFDLSENHIRQARSDRGWHEGWSSPESRTRIEPCEPRKRCHHPACGHLERSSGLKDKWCYAPVHDSPDILRQGASNFRGWTWRMASFSSGFVRQPRTADSPMQRTWAVSGNAWKARLERQLQPC